MKPLTILLVLFSFTTTGCPLPEVGGKGQPCADSDEPCDPGLACRPFDELCIVPECTPEDPACPAGKHCDFNEYACKTGSASCQSAGDCQTGYYCDLTTHQCMPLGTEGQIGDPCTFDNSSDEYDALFPDAPTCANGLECIGYFPSPDNGSCSESADCWKISLVTNADCSGGACGGAMCMAPCGTGDTCDPGFTPLYTVGEECYCSNQIEDRFCNPALDTGCGAGEKCMLWSRSQSEIITVCVPEGTSGLGGSCSWLVNNMCQTGLMCVDDGSNTTCWKVCDTLNDQCTTGSCTAYPNTHWGLCPPGA